MLSFTLSNKKNPIELLRQFESIFKAHESGGPGVPLNEKTKGRKSRETVPLNEFQRSIRGSATSAVFLKEGNT
jgi:hypothetical protein